MSRVIAAAFFVITVLLVIRYMRPRRLVADCEVVTPSPVQYVQKSVAGMKGEKGDKGDPGKQGPPGVRGDGKSAIFPSDKTFTLSSHHDNALYYLSGTDFNSVGVSTDPADAIQWTLTHVPESLDTAIYRITTPSGERLSSSADGTVSLGAALAGSMYTMWRIVRHRTVGGQWTNRLHAVTGSKVEDPVRLLYLGDADGVSAVVQNDSTVASQATWAFNLVSS